MREKTIPTVNEALLNREMGLSEVRALLSQTIERLKSSETLKEYAGKQLKEFWQKEYPPAPFEELFTLKQIAEINIDTFFKKRSVLPSKILGIIAAIEKAVNLKSKRAVQKKPEKNISSSYNKVNKKIKFLEIEYSALISRCEKSIEILNLAEDSCEANAKNTKIYNSIAADIKKIDKLLSTNQDKISKLI